MSLTPDLQRLAAEIKQQHGDTLGAASALHEMRLAIGRKLNHVWPQLRHGMKQAFLDAAGIEASTAENYRSYAKAIDSNSENFRICDGDYPSYAEVRQLAPMERKQRRAPATAPSPAVDNAWADAAQSIQHAIDNLTDLPKAHRLASQLLSVVTSAIENKRS